MYGKAFPGLFSLALVASLLGATARAEPPVPPPVPAPASPLDATPAPCVTPAPPPAPCLGGPPAVHKCEVPSDTGSYIGYYVGGGVPIGGDARCANEGVWGWDYSGCFFQRCVTLFWTHGRLNQGGTGAYKSEGPKVLHLHEEGHGKEGGEH